MKNYALLTMAFLTAAPLGAEVKLAPYYALQVSEGASVPSAGDWMLSLNLLNDMGIIVQPAEGHRLVGFYELKYTGPGLRTEEGAQFTDRTMDHVFILRHHYSFPDGYTLKTQLDYMIEYKRTGANEVWGSGLYDFNRTGAGITLERAWENGLTASVNQQYHLLDFPNYTDLLTEFQTGGQNIDSATGKQNHSVYQAKAGLSYGPTQFSLEYILMSYAKQKVIVGNVQTDGTYYSGTLQQDNVLCLGLRRDQRLTRKIRVSPSVDYRIKSSNQNYQHFTVANSTVPVAYVAQFYDYQQMSFSLPMSFILSKSWEFFLSPQWDVKSYFHRPPRDTNNNLLAGTQANNLLLVGTGFTLRSSEVTSTTFFYTYQSQSSNTRFEKYFPYNFSGSCFGVSFDYHY